MNEKKQYQCGFEKLEAWQLSRLLVKEVYSLTRKFPFSERYGLTSQMNRAAISVPSNLAEGSSRSSMKERAHFTRISYGSLMELLNLIYLCYDLELIEREMMEYIKLKILEISNKINSLHKYQASFVKKEI